MVETNDSESSPIHFEIDEQTGRFVASKLNPNELEKEAFKILGVMRQIDPKVDVVKLFDTPQLSNLFHFH